MWVINAKYVKMASSIIAGPSFKINLENNAELSDGA
jgi:hypothetical protein